MKEERGRKEIGTYVRICLLLRTEYAPLKPVPQDLSSPVCAVSIIPPPNMVPRLDSSVPSFQVKSCAYGVDMHACPV